MSRLKAFFLSLILIISSSTIWLTSCSESEISKPDFDRTTMLQNMADNLIKPAYSDLMNSVLALQTATTNFTENTTSTTLKEAQLAWEASYLDFQYTNAYNFGPAGPEGLQKAFIEEVAIFPVNADKIENAISTGTYSLTDANRDTRGFLAVEYLLFNVNEGSSSVVAKFESASRKKYLNDLMENLRSRTEAISTAWNTGFSATFIANNGTNVGSSTSALYNEFLKSFEALKNFKLGLPLGKISGQTHTEPTKVEAYYSGKSIEMLKAHMQALENIWYGRSKSGIDGIGFEEYLQNVTGGEALISATKMQLENISLAMDAVSTDSPLSVQIQNAPNTLDALFTELQKNTRYFKSDMSSLLGIAITFSDADGD
ncbi:MAG TPA: imelysin family protein [Fulvivirga sp.]|nr:imelysin family protein [Fulvivirga sp.]